MQVILLVDGCHFNLWEKAVETQGRGAFTVIAVQGQGQGQGGQGQSSEVKYDHTYLQAMMQTPHYALDGPSPEGEQGPTGTAGVTRALIKTALSAEYPNRVNAMNIQDGEGREAERVMYDFTGRWRDICSKAVLGTGGVTGGHSKDRGEGYCTVAIRPDGHVTHVLPFQEAPSLEQAVEHLNSIRTTLHII